MSEKQNFNEQDLQGVVGGSVPPPEKPSIEGEGESSGGTKSRLSPAEVLDIAGGGDPRGTRGIPAPEQEVKSDDDTRQLSPQEIASLAGGGDPRGTRGIPAPEPEVKDDGSRSSGPDIGG